MRSEPLPPELLYRPFTTAQAVAAGMSRKQLRSKRCVQLHRDVYAAADLELTLPIRAAAVALVLPDDAVIGYDDAAWLLGADVRTRSDGPLKVVGQQGDQIRRAGVQATSALLEPGDVTEVFGIPVTSPVRTAFDLARRRDLIESVVGIDAMLNRGGCDLDELASYVEEHRGWRGVRWASAALGHAEPLAQSPMETRQRMRLVLSGLPRPRAQAPVYDEHGDVFAYIDNGYEEWKVGLDYDGEDHSKQWRRDLERQEQIRDRGWWHRRYTSLHIRSGFQLMVDQAARELMRAGWRPGSVAAPFAAAARAARISPAIMQ